MDSNFTDSKRSYKSLTSKCSCGGQTFLDGWTSGYVFLNIFVLSETVLHWDGIALITAISKGQHFHSRWIKSSSVLHSCLVQMNSIINCERPSNRSLCWFALFRLTDVRALHCCNIIHFVFLCCAFPDGMIIRCRCLSPGRIWSCEQDIDSLILCLPSTSLLVIAGFDWYGLIAKQMPRPSFWE